MKFSGLFLVAFLFLSVLATAQEKLPIIDMHLHALKVGPPFPKTEPVIGFVAPETSEKLSEETLDALERNNVVLALTSGPMVDSYSGGATEIMAGCGFMGLEPIDVLRQKLISGACKAISEFAPQYRGLRPDHPDLEPYFALAEELDLPVGIHMGLGPPGAAYMGLKDYRMMDSNPLYLEEVLIRHPNMRLFVSHAGWPMLDEMIGLLHAHPQVYVDIAILNWGLPKKEFYTYLERLVNAGFGERIMYGSDQMTWPQAIDKSIESIESAPFLSKKQMRDILYNNAARFLNLSEEEIARHHGKK